MNKIMVNHPASARARTGHPREEMVNLARRDSEPLTIRVTSHFFCRMAERFPFASDLDADFITYLLLSSRVVPRRPGQIRAILRNGGEAIYLWSRDIIMVLAYPENYGQPLELKTAYRTQSCHWVTAVINKYGNAETWPWFVEAHAISAPAAEEDENRARRLAKPVEPAASAHGTDRPMNSKARKAHLRALEMRAKYDDEYRQWAEARQQPAGDGRES